VLAVQSPLTSLGDDVAATKRIIATAKGEVVLAGHSWGGTIITEAGADPKVTALVYISAFGNDAGESGSELIGKYPKPPALSAVQMDGAGFVTSTVEGFIENHCAGSAAGGSPNPCGDPGPPRGEDLRRKSVGRCLEDQAVMVRGFGERPDDQSGTRGRRGREK